MKTAMKTFNGKPQHKNILAVILAVVGIVLLAITWLYHLMVHYVTMPRSEWIDFKNPDAWVHRDDYPNAFCNYFCNIEASLIHQLYIFRVGFGTEYCNEETTDKS
jgi:hypothetical protein